MPNLNKEAEHAKSISQLCNVDNILYNPKSIQAQKIIEEYNRKYNFNYTFSGPDEIAPVKVFDDGEFTYFEFRN